jgi:hypothetical protein
VSPLEHWLARVHRRHQRRSDLAAALLLGEGGRYARQRLSPMLLRVLVRTALHAVEIYLLMLALPFEYLAPLLGYRALVQIAGTAHWGALEPLRRRVREQAPAAVRWTITRWLSASTALGVLPALWFVLRMLDPRTPLSLFDAYGFACCARLAGDVYARTLHSGVFALRRVYRPLSSLVVADALELALIIAGFDALGPWVLPLAISISGALDVSLSVLYTRRAYRRRRWQLPRISDARRAFARAQLRAEWKRQARELAAASVAHATTQLDGWLLLLLVARVDEPHAGGASLALAYYVLRPCLGFSAQWVRAFYFDLSRLEAGALQAFRAHLARYLRNVGFGCAALIALPGVIAAAYVDPRQDRWALACLVPLAFVRALFAQRQLEAFVRQRYVRLSLVGAVLAAGFIALAACEPSTTPLLLSAVGLLALGCVLLPAPLGSSEPDGGLAAWLHATRASARVQLAVMRVGPVNADAGRVARVLADALPGARVARCGRAQLVVSTDEAALSNASLIAVTGGALRELWVSGYEPGSEVLQAARARLPELLARALDADAPSPSALIAEFRSAFAGGTLLDLRSGAGRIPQRCLRRGQLSELLAQIVLACRQREATRRVRLPLSLAVYAPAGRAELVFIVPRAQEAFAPFRARVLDATLAAALHVDHAQPAGAKSVFARWLAAVARQRNARVLPS